MSLITRGLNSNALISRGLYGFFSTIVQGIRRIFTKDTDRRIFRRK